MKIVIILISLALARYVNTEKAMRNWHWFDKYLNILSIPISKANEKMPWLGLAVIILPVIIALYLVLKIFGGGLHHFIHFLMSTAVLWYCLSVISVRQDFEAYQSALMQEDKQNASTAAAPLIGSDLPASNAQTARAVTNAIFWQPLHRIFGVLFWFVILGPVGALLYHLLIVLRETAATGNVEALSVSHEAAVAQSILDWLPVRVIGLGYALAGHFAPTFSYWRKNLLLGLEHSKQFLTMCGMLALNAKEIDAEMAEPAEQKLAMALVARTLIILLLILVIFSLGMLAYR